MIQSEKHSTKLHSWLGRCKGDTNHGMQPPPATGKGKETNCPLELPEGNTACQHLGISPVRPGLTYKPQN